MPGEPVTWVWRVSGVLLLGASGALRGQQPAPPAPPPLVVQQQANVTATRSSVEVGATADTVSTLSADQLQQFPALTLDERLRQHAGFDLFRRSSFWVANPTSEGTSLRGLGSTAASRTLVLSSGVPLNDPFGGWVHWDEFPPQTLEAVTLASGGGSDLYGSSALGGVIEVVPAAPGPALLTLDVAGAADDTLNASGRADAQQHGWSELLASQVFQTAGYTTIAPSLRGVVDIPSNLHFETGRTEVDRTWKPGQRAFVIANVLNEARNNGTPLQTNGTRLWRGIFGDDWKLGDATNGRLRGFGSDEAYRQSFSAINAARSSETLTRTQQVRSQEAGLSADASWSRRKYALVAGGDVRDIRATDVEVPFVAGQANGVQDTSARQRFTGGFVEALGSQGRWSVAASIRLDNAANLSTRTLAQSGHGSLTSSSLPDHSELVPSPRLGVLRTFAGGWQARASGFRAFRAPTMNELYRTGQVGQQTTLANASLVSERATGAEGGVDWASGGRRFAAQTTYFWTAVNRPVSAVLVSSTPTSLTNKRENLGRIVSQGVEIGTQIEVLHNLSATVGYQYAHATVTSFSAQASLVGRWIPNVARNAATAQLRYRPTTASLLTLNARQTGRAFDDSSNVYELHGFFVLDAYAEMTLHTHVTAYVAVQNVLNRSIETARTPNLTLGTPVTAQGGLRFRLGGR